MTTEEALQGIQADFWKQQLPIGSRVMIPGEGEGTVTGYWSTRDQIQALVTRDERDDFGPSEWTFCHPSELLKLPPNPRPRTRRKAAAIMPRADRCTRPSKG